MNSFQKLKVVSCFLLFIFHFSHTAVAQTEATRSSETTIDNSYAAKGYRLSISSIRVLKNGSNSAKIEFNLSNSGRNRIKLGKGRNIPPTIIFDFDESLNKEGFYNHANAIATALRNEKISLRPGQLLMKNKLKVDFNNTIADLVIQRTEEETPIENSDNSVLAIENLEIETPVEETVITAPENEVQVEVVMEETMEIENVEPLENVNEIVEETSISTAEEKNVEEIMEEEIVIEETKKIQNEESIKEAVEVNNNKLPSLELTETIMMTERTHHLPTVEEIVIRTETMENETVENSIESSKEKVVEANVETPVEETNEVVETNIETPIEETNEVVETNVETLTEEEIESEQTIEELTQPIEDEVVEAPIEDEYDMELEEELVADRTFSETDICPDLVLESIRILKQSENSVTLEYVLVNNGNGSAALYGESKKDDDNVAIKAYLSKSRRLTRGSIPLKGAYISKGVKNKSGMLLPKQKVKATMKLQINKLTKFTPVLILKLDGFHDVEECNEDNNKVFINLIEVAEVNTDVYPKSKTESETKVLSKVGN